LGVQVRAYTKTTYTTIRDRNGARVSGFSDDSTKSVPPQNPARATGKAAKVSDVAHHASHTGLLLAAYKAAQAIRRSRPVSSRGPPVGKTIFTSTVSSADTAFLEAAGISDAMLLDPNIASRLTELFARHEPPSILSSTSTSSGSNKI
jgi:hypothetical protein